MEFARYKIPCLSSANLRNIELYEMLLKEHGATPRALDWGSEASQKKRFKVLSEIEAKPMLAPLRILDVGCGLGDFQTWLSEAGMDPYYTGIDITPGMIEAAKTAHPSGLFLVWDLIEESLGKTKYDYVFASGIFAKRSDGSEFMREMISAMFAACSVGVAFNSLSTWAAEKEEGEFQADPIETLEFCRTITPLVCLRHEYMPHDFTIYLRRS